MRAAVAGPIVSAHRENRSGDHCWAKRRCFSGMCSATVVWRPLSGSSPRVRGTASPGRRRISGSRFIPARAGNRLWLWLASIGYSVHPRACGEQSFPSWIAAPRTGSSPRVRGTDARLDAGRRGLRFIPARAGNRCRVCHRGSLDAVHPRACGEQGDAQEAQDPAQGSSPRVRGTAKRRHHDLRVVRFIPARAGNRLCRNPCRQEGAVHPARAGNSTPTETRGTVPPVIPARAGNRVRFPTISGPASVHPRACGEQASIVGPVTTKIGSSPRVRGTAAPADANPLRAGSSPRVRGTGFRA